MTVRHPLRAFVVIAAAGLAAAWTVGAVLAAARRRRKADTTEIEAFGRLPDTDEELADATRLAIASINEEPWERWW